MNYQTMTRKALQTIANEYACKSLLSIGSDSKTVKGEKLGVLTGILYMLPDDHICPVARLAGCREGCLVTAGRASIYQSIMQARQARSKFWYGNPDAFLSLLERDIESLQRKAKRKGMECAVRLNGTSDINWTRAKLANGQTLFERFADVQFYDYTKTPRIAKDSMSIGNYHVTLSFSGASQRYMDLVEKTAAETGCNMAVVFRTKYLPDTFRGRKVVNGDLTDLRFTDPSGVIVGLKAKGQAKKDASGFVID
jgi:hypothetical protein